MNSKLYVGNISSETTEADLCEAFEPFGAVTKVHLASKHRIKRARSFAFVTFSTEEESKLAAEKLNGVDLKGRPLTVKSARLPSAASKEVRIPAKMRRPDDSMLHVSNDLWVSLQRDEAALYENVRDWRFDGATREFASLHALLDLQFSQIGERLALLATRSGNFGCVSSRAGKEHVLAIRRQDGTYDVSELEIVAALAELHVALSLSLERSAEVFRTRFREIETASVLCDLAEFHKKDAAMLRALLRKNKGNAPSSDFRS